MTYIYYCEVCGKEVEKWHRILEEPEYFCEDHTPYVKMKKRITGGVGVILKGQGWASKGNATAGKVKKTFEKTLVGRKKIGADTPDPRKILKPIMEGK